MVMSSLPPEEAAQTLVDLANLLGGPDNITAIIVEAPDTETLANGSGKPRPVSSASPGAKGNAAADWLAGGLTVAAIAGALALLALARPVLAGALAVVTLVWAIGWFARRSKLHDAALQVRGQHGKGPYRQYVCTPSDQNIDMLSDIVRQLEDLEDQRDWPFDWAEIHADRHAAYKAIAAGDHVGAVVAYASAVRRLMHAVRAARPEPPGDSGIGLGR
jgi:protein phosphatase